MYVAFRVCLQYALALSSFRHQRASERHATGSRSLKLIQSAYSPSCNNRFRMRVACRALHDTILFTKYSETMIFVNTFLVSWNFICLHFQAASLELRKTDLLLFALLARAIYFRSYFGLFICYCRAELPLLLIKHTVELIASFFLAFRSPRGTLTISS